MEHPAWGLGWVTSQLVPQDCKAVTEVAGMKGHRAVEATESQQVGLFRM